MKMIYKIEKSIQKTSVALGFFDGIHLGHKKLIESVVKDKEIGLIPTVLTFKKKPLEYFNIEEDNLKLLYLISNENKAKILDEIGVEQVYFLDFLEIKNLTAEEFVYDILVKNMNAKRVFCGFNYHFGSGGYSTSDTLKKICSKYDIEVISIDPVMYRDEIVSSTRIRKALVNGNVEEANNMLDRCFCYDFEIKKGNQIGRTIKTPTINQPFPEKFILPKFGVYASVVEIDNKLYHGVTNIGVKPTIGEYKPLSETWVPENNLKELYGEKVKVRLLKYIREEKKFDNIEQLHKQILLDSIKSEKIFKEINVNNIT